MDIIIPPSIFVPFPSFLWICSPSVGSIDLRYLPAMRYLCYCCWFLIDIDVVVVVAVDDVVDVVVGYCCCCCYLDDVVCSKLFSPNVLIFLELLQQKIYKKVRNDGLDQTF